MLMSGEIMSVYVEAIKNRLLHEIEIYGKIVSSENKKYEYLINHSPTEGEV